METIAIILTSASLSQVIKREGRDILALQSDYPVVFKLAGRVAPGAKIADVYDRDGTLVEWTLVADEPRCVDMDIFAGLHEFQIVLPQASGADINIYIGFRDLR